MPAPPWHFSRAREDTKRADKGTGVVFGDGKGPQPLALNPDKTFALSHTYSSPGSFVVAVWVADKDGAVGSGSFSVYVLPQPVTVTSLTIATVTVGTGKKAKKTTGLVLHFSDDLNAAQAGRIFGHALSTGGDRWSERTYCVSATHEMRM